MKEKEWTTSFDNIQNLKTFARDAACNFVGTTAAENTISAYWGGFEAALNCVEQQLLRCDIENTVPLDDDEGKAIPAIQKLFSEKSAIET